MPTNLGSFASKTLAAATIAFIFAIPGWAQVTEKILYSFVGFTDGGNPQPGLVLDSKGNLYGTTLNGGANFEGTVFEVTPNSNGTWTEQVIHSFSGFTGTGDGALPFGGLILDAQGNLYGTTNAGGLNGGGTVFELSPGLNGAWTETILYAFAGGSDGFAPFAGVVFDSAGNLYGTTERGGTAGVGPNTGFGVVFELSPGANGTWAKKNLHIFSGADDGAIPGSNLVVDSLGNLYGVAQTGGANDYGVVFQLAPQPDGSWVEHVIHPFSGGADGMSSYGGAAVDKAGNIFVEAYFSVLEFSPSSGGGWTKKNLHNFTGGADGAGAAGGLILDSSGNIYGMTNYGGHHHGAVFELTRGSQGNWTEEILHNFEGGSDGDFPEFNYLTLDPKGNVHGTTQNGGSSNSGIVFELSH
jgi:uncharacterized repeat protein (TIGR03803 family)